MIVMEAENGGNRLMRRPVKDIHADLKAILVRSGIYDSLDYFEIATGKKKTENGPFPEFEWLACAPVTSGGRHYVYIGTVCRGRYNLIFVGKTSKGFQAACEVANRCAQELGA